MKKVEKLARAMAEAHHGRVDRWSLRESLKDIADRAMLKGRVKVLSAALALMIAYS